MVMQMQSSDASHEHENEGRATACQQRINLFKRCCLVLFFRCFVLVTCLFFFFLLSKRCKDRGNMGQGSSEKENTETPKK